MNTTSMKQMLSTLDNISAGKPTLVESRSIKSSTILEGKVKDLTADLKSTKSGGLSDAEFKIKYKKTKKEMKSSITEAWDERAKDKTCETSDTKLGQFSSSADSSEEPWICNDCNGSGEGMHDGSVCQTCHGSGEAPSDGDTSDDYDEDFDEEDRGHWFESQCCSTISKKKV